MNDTMDAILEELHAICDDIETKLTRRKNVKQFALLELSVVNIDTTSHSDSADYIVKRLVKLRSLLVLHNKIDDDICMVVYMRNLIPIALQASSYVLVNPSITDELLKIMNAMCGRSPSTSNSRSNSNEAINIIQQVYENDGIGVLLVALKLYVDVSSIRSQGLEALTLTIQYIKQKYCSSSDSSFFPSISDSISRNTINAITIANKTTQQLDEEEQFIDKASPDKYYSDNDNNMNIIKDIAHIMLIHSLPTTFSRLFIIYAKVSNKVCIERCIDCFKFMLKHTTSVNLYSKIAGSHGFGIVHSLLNIASTTSTTTDCKHDCVTFLILLLINSHNILDYISSINQGWTVFDRLYQDYKTTPIHYEQLSINIRKQLFNTLTVYHKKCYDNVNAVQPMTSRERKRRKRLMPVYKSKLDGITMFMSNHFPQPIRKKKSPVIAVAADSLPVSLLSADKAAFPSVDAIDSVTTTVTIAAAVATSIIKAASASYLDPVTEANDGSSAHMQTSNFVPTATINASTTTTTTSSSVTSKEHLISSNHKKKPVSLSKEGKKPLVRIDPLPPNAIDIPTLIPSVYIANKSRPSTPVMNERTEIKGVSQKIKDITNYLLPLGNPYLEPVVYRPMSASAGRGSNASKDRRPKSAASRLESRKVKGKRYAVTSSSSDTSSDTVLKTELSNEFLSTNAFIAEKLFSVSDAPIDGDAVAAAMYDGYDTSNMPSKESEDMATALSSLSFSERLQVMIMQIRNASATQVDNE